MTAPRRPLPTAGHAVGVLAIALLATLATPSTASASHKTPIVPPTGDASGVTSPTTATSATSPPTSATSPTASATGTTPTVRAASTTTAARSAHGSTPTTSTSTAKGAKPAGPSGASTKRSTPTTTSAPNASSTAKPSPAQEAARSDEEQSPLTQEQVQAQLAQAAALRAQLKATDTRLSAATEALQAVSNQVAAALEGVRVAKEQEEAALAQRERQLRILAKLTQRLSDSQDELGRWARSAYAIGGPMATYESWLIALGGASSSEVGHQLALLEEVGVVVNQQIRSYEAATTLQQVTARQAQLAAAQAQAARQRADAAAAQAKQLLAKQRLALAELRLEQARLMGAAALDAQQRDRLAEAEAWIRATGGSLDAAGQCVGLDTSSYPNGAIPPAAMCPLWGADGHLLRADAAAGFNRLSKAYAAQFGTPLCVTDSYRTLAEQVRLARVKPTLAARPGTSNHGWGTAADLCGGIQSFGTLEHAWMLAHAPLHGWFHPAWAGPSGSRPEPWHWEFAG